MKLADVCWNLISTRNVFPMTEPKNARINDEEEWVSTHKTNIILFRFIVRNILPQITIYYQKDS